MARTITNTYATLVSLATGDNPISIVATAALQKQFETFIREAPEQWMWAHRKWDEGRGGRYSEIFGIIPGDE